MRNMIGMGRKMLCGWGVCGVIALSGCPAGSVRVTVDPDGPLTLAEGFVLRIRADQTTGTTGSNSCMGFFPETPNYTFTVLESLTGLTVRVESDENVSLLIRFGQSNFCGVAADAAVEVSRGSWSPGTYDVFVGTPNEGGTADYALEIIE